MIEVTYHYMFGEEFYSQSFCFSKPIYPNIYLAQEAINKKKEVINSVWLNPKNPNQSRLMRSFPLKEGVYLIVSLFVLVYFFLLKFQFNRSYEN